MRNPNDFFVRLGRMILLIVAAAIAMLAAVLYLGQIGKGISAIFGALRPILTGAVVAYLLTPIAKRLEGFFQKRLAKTKLSKQKAEKLSRGLSVIASLLFLILLLVGFFAMLLPQLYHSLVGLANSIPDYFRDAEAQILKFLDDEPELRAFVESQHTKVYIGLIGLLIHETFIKIWDVVSNLTSSLLSVVSFLVDFLLGLVAAVYILWSRNQFLAQAKKLTAALCKPAVADRIYDIARRAHKTFSGYIVGTLTDALLVGVITYVVSLILGFPYAPIIATVVGCTNIIPILGPFLGAAPSAIIILLVDPWKCLYFIIFIIILQQVDGNIIAPRIISGNTGLSGFWVLTAITVAGSLFGLAGLVICVPVTAVAYSLISEWVSRRLGKKGMPTDTATYAALKEMAELPSAEHEESL